MIKALILTTFVHGTQHLRRGDEAEFPPGAFVELSALGLVREAEEQQPQQPQPQEPAQRSQRPARTPANKQASAPEAKDEGAADATADA